jgi:hypothetical protein
VYHDIKLFDNPKSIEEAIQGFSAVGYLRGCIDGLVFMQDVLYNQMFSEKYLSPKERKEWAKKMNFNRLNVPEEGIPVGQMILIFYKYAENHPENL